MISPRSNNSQNNKQLYTFTGGAFFGFFLASSLFVFLSDLQNTTGCNKSQQQLMMIPNPTNAVSLGISAIYPLSDISVSSKGWKTIRVFYGDFEHIADSTTLPTPYFQANRWFSQYRQDEIIARLLQGKQKGYFVDLASNDAVRISNTYALETFFQWQGICLEPNPVYWGGLAYRKCHVVAAVVGNQTMEEVEFTFPKAKAPKGGIIGSGYGKSRDKAENIQRRYTVTLTEIFQQFQAPKIIDYLSLDVEGAEDLVMSSFPFEDYRFNLLTIERPSDQLSKILEANDYILLKTLKASKETLWIHSSITHSVDMSALNIDSQNYKYRENSGNERVSPEETF
jgi:hypothetical protein